MNPSSLFFPLRPLILTLALLSSSNTWANGPFVMFAIENGGDTLAEDNALFSSKLHAGGFIHFALGYQVALNSNLKLSSSIGFKNDNLIADNGEADFTRFPLELMLHANLSRQLSLGGGVSYHLAPSYRDNFSQNGFGKFVQEFDDALGVVVQLSYRFNNQSERALEEEAQTSGFNMGLRLTSIDYQAASLSTPVNGDSVGLFFGFHW